jgi:hypothetical protein
MLDQYPHNQGSYITRVGDPTCSAPKRKRKKPKKERSDSAPPGKVEEELREEQEEREMRRGQSLDGMDLVQLYTKKLRRANKEMVKLADQQKRELYGPASKWYKGVGQCDITSFANNYVHCCGTNPFSKNQLMFSR